MVFQRLNALHEHYREDTYLDTQKLFTVVDLDIQKIAIKNYKFPDTEAVFRDLYHQVNINHSKKYEHKIFVTGLIHKEAYLLLPGLQCLFDKHKNPILFQERKLDRASLYQQVIDDSEVDQDLHKNFSIFYVTSQKVLVKTNKNNPCVLPIDPVRYRV